MLKNLLMKAMVLCCVSIMLMTAKTAAQTANIYIGSNDQTIRGFGGMNFPRWIDDLSSAQADKAFGNGYGQIGLSILRISVSPDQNQWNLEVPTAQRAAGHGAIVFATPWSPPASMKTNGSTIQGQLRTDQYAAYANYLRDFCNYMSSNGVSLYAVSVQNEPDWLPDYESCGWSGSQIRTFLDNNASVIPTRVMAPETVHYKEDYMNAIASSSQVDILANHLYGGPPTLYNSSKDQWMTEHYVNSNISANAWPEALEAGKEVHDVMINGYNAYIWWYIRRSYGLITDDGNVSKRGFVMSHFSKFVRPGYVRVRADAAPTSGVSVSAYQNGNTLVVVAINQNSSSRTINFGFSGNNVANITKYETTGTTGHNVSEVGNYSGGTSLSNTLAGYSISTFVGTIGGSTGGNITVRARGAQGGEQIELRADNNVIGSWTLGTAYQDYSADGSGTISVHFVNDNGDLDVQVDYVSIDGTVMQAEDQATNTGVWQNSSCGGSYSEWLHCNGYIEFGSSTPCDPTAITPYISVNDGSWQQTANVSITSGDKVELGPQPSTGGSWSWTGCGTSGTSREQILYPTGSCTATATYTNDCGAQSTQNFNITVSGSSGGGEVWLEAECGTVGSLWNTPSDGNASNNQYVTVQSGNNSLGSAPTNTSGHITYSFDLSESGSYTLWARVITPSPNDDSFWLRMDGGSWFQWNNIGPNSSWTWEQAQSYTLSAGTHTFTVAYREDGAQLDKVYITNTGDTPTGLGDAADNCAGSGDYSVTVRALGTDGSEQITLSVGGTTVQSWTLGTAMSDYTANTSLSGNIRVEFTNDDGTVRDVQVDYIRINGTTTLQAEDQATNTGVWQNSSCGGSNSEWLHCGGYIEFSAFKNAATPAGHESLQPSELTLYPVPAGDRLQIRFDAEADRISGLSLYDISGNLVLSKQISGGYHLLDLHQLPGGIYFLKLTTGAMTETRKFVKE